MATINEPNRDPARNEPQGTRGENWPMTPEVEQEFTSEEAVEFDKRDVAKYDQVRAEPSRAEAETIPDVPSDTDYH